MYFAQFPLHLQGLALCLHQINEFNEMDSSPDIGRRVSVREAMPHPITGDSVLTPMLRADESDRAPLSVEQLESLGLPPLPRVPPGFIHPPQPEQPTPLPGETLPYQ